LHLGSLYAAAASYLDARAHGGRWLLRIEDLDALREAPGAQERMLRTLQDFGFEWDGEVVYQSARLGLYEAALERLSAGGQSFRCLCSRAQLSEEGRYAGTCRDAAIPPHASTSTRLRVEPGIVAFTDRIVGAYEEDVAARIGDLLLKRRDQVFAYLLAVVVDDAEQGVTHIVRGGDLLDNTPRQIYLQRALGVTQPRYAHVPTLIDAHDAKLSKSRRSISLNEADALPQLLSVFHLLGLPAGGRRFAKLHQAWDWGIRQWNINNVPKCLNLQVTAK
jgi:glutamyl-Q tRNA(Asp) synthetase